ncbi:hypothetical protein GCM10009557_79730 [Virgisporangium ochraceum]
MVLRTRFTELLGVRHPIALAPMGGSAGGALAAAVSRGGGLGMVGAGPGDPEWMDRELPLAAARPDLPWGVGFLAWAAGVDAVRHALEYGPRAVMLSFGDPAPFAGAVRAVGAILIVQATDLDEARRAVDVGVDVIVAQGTEAGGHGARRGRSTLPFVPVVVDLVAPTPVPDCPMRTMSRGASSPRCRDGPASPSTSSPTCRRRPTSSSRWPTAPRRRWRLLREDPGDELHGAVRGVAQDADHVLDGLRRLAGPESDHENEESDGGWLEELLHVSASFSLNVRRDFAVTDGTEGVRGVTRVEAPFSAKKTVPHSLTRPDAPDVRRRMAL